MGSGVRGGACAAVEAPAWRGRERFLSASATEPCSVLGCLCPSQARGACPGRDAPGGHTLLTGIALQPRRGTARGGGCGGEPGAAQPKGSRAPSALMRLLIAVYASGYNLAIALPESIKGLASNGGASYS